MSNSKSATPITPNREKPTSQPGSESGSEFAAAATPVRKHPVAKIETGKISEDEDTLVGRSKAELIAAEALVELSKVERVFE